MAETEKKDQRREEIMDAAWAVFAERGYAGATTQEIAKRARASKETLYAWFGDKERLFETLLLERLKNVGAGVAVEAAPDYEPERVLFLIARDLLRFLCSPHTMELLRIATLDAPRFPKINRTLAKSLDRKDFAAAMERWRARGLMEFDDAEEAASMFMAMAQGEWPTRLSYGSVKSMSEAQIEKHARYATRMFLKAVAPARKN